MKRYELSQDLAHDILARAKARGASQADVVMAESESFFVTVRVGEVEKISQSGEKRLGLRLFFGNSSASASTSDISEQAIEKLVEDTALMARATAQDPHGGLPDANELARDIPDLDLLDEGARSVSVEEKIQIALDTEKSALAFDKRITNSEGAEFSNGFGRVIYASSHGLAVNTKARTSVTQLPRWRNPTARCSATTGTRPTANSPAWNRRKASARWPPGGCSGGSAQKKSKPAKCPSFSNRRSPHRCCEIWRLPSPVMRFIKGRRS